MGTDVDITVAAKPNGNGVMYIGKRYVNGYFYASSSVDEIKLYNRQLSQEEISDMY